MPEQMQQLPIEKSGPKQVQDGGGPKIPNISKPDTGRILKRMRSSSSFSRLLIEYEQQKRSSPHIIDIAELITPFFTVI